MHSLCIKLTFFEVWKENQVKGIMQLNGDHVHRYKEIKYSKKMAVSLTSDINSTYQKVM